MGRVLSILLAITTIIILSFVGLFSHYTFYWWYNLIFPPTVGGPQLWASPYHTQDLMRIIISLMLLPCALFIILSSRYKPTDKHWAYATVGTIIGFWLKG
jgi:hypothetical protein